MTHSRRVRAFTLMEALIAAGLALAIIAAIYSFLAMTGRSFLKEDEQLKASRQLQELVDKLREDFTRAEGDTITPDDINKDVLKEMGYPSGPQQLLEEQRYAQIDYHEYNDMESKRPRFVKSYLCRKRFAYFQEPGGGWRKELVKNSEEWLNDQPPPLVMKELIPQSSYGPAILITSPEVDASDYLIMKVGSPSAVGVVIWAYHRKKVGKIPRGTLLRWSKSTGLVDLNKGGSDAEFYLMPVVEWVYVEKNEANKEVYFPLKNMLTMNVGVGRRPVGLAKGVSFDQLVSSARFTWGP